MFKLFGWSRRHYEDKTGNTRSMKKRIIRELFDMVGLLGPAEKQFNWGLMIGISFCLLV
ncbi:hypothetical protein ES703_97036 [subsurface metagenome]